MCVCVRGSWGWESGGGYWWKALPMRVKGKLWSSLSSLSPLPVSSGGEIERIFRCEWGRSFFVVVVVPSARPGIHSARFAVGKCN